MWKKWKTSFDHLDFWDRNCLYCNLCTFFLPVGRIIVVLPIFLLLGLSLCSHLDSFVSIHFDENYPQCAFWRVGSGKGGALAKWILGVTNLFVVVWAIVGILSMFKYERDCRDSSPAVWSMAWATVVVSFMICCCGGFVGYNVATTEAEIVSEEEP